MEWLLTMIIKTLPFDSFYAKEANLFLHNHLESGRFDIDKESYT